MVCHAVQENQRIMVSIYCDYFGARGRLKMRDWNYRHHQKCRGGKCRTKQLWKAKTPAGLEV